MLKRRGLIVTLLLSSFVHLAIAGSLIYFPLRYSRNDRLLRGGKIIWGVVSGQVAGSREQLSGSREQGVLKRRTSGVRSEKSEVSEARDENREIRRQEREIEGQIMREIPSSERERGERGDSEVLYSHLEGSRTGMDGGCNVPEECTNNGVSNDLPSGVHGTFANGIASVTYGISANGERSGGDRLRDIIDGIRLEIERHKYYPPFARKNGIEGTVYMTFHLGRDGRPKGITIERSSGFKILDDSATKIIEKIGRFPIGPAEIEGLDITVPIAYRLREDKN